MFSSSFLYDTSFCFYEVKGKGAFSIKVCIEYEQGIYFFADYYNFPQRLGFTVVQPLSESKSLKSVYFKTTFEEFHFPTC